MNYEREVIMDSEDVEVQLLIEGINLVYGYDFTNYSRAHIKRRMKYRMGKENLKSISQLQHHILNSESFFKNILPDFSINVTEMFRDPEVFIYFREVLLPELAKKPRIKIWHAGCSSGEEVYSMAILLKEEGLYDRAIIYATDFNDKILKVAKAGIFPIEAVKIHTKNYIQSGGKQAFSNYYRAKYDSVIIDQSLKENISFANHNLVTDNVFGEMDLIICRNVLIYFERVLQDRVFNLFDESLAESGTLCLGIKETLKYSQLGERYKTLDKDLKIYRKND